MFSSGYCRIPCANMELLLLCGTGAPAARHAHRDHAVAGCVLQGSVLWESKGLARRLAKRDIFYAPPGLGHSVLAEMGAAVLVACVPRGAGAVLPGADVLERALDALGLRPNRPLAHLALLLAVEARRAEPDPAQARGAALAARELCVAMAARPEEPFSLGLLARQSGFSAWHLLRAITRECGMTPHAFLLSCRISQVRRLLRAGVPAAEAAAAAGFSDQSHMQRVFRRHHGCTPREFLRRSCRPGQR